ncbi:MAG: hypothetical protein JSS63_14905 [Bacteroidetes bacterium]|nr:hypothetical protein [Bacteroidota bacterium]MBX7046345.1 hypothetical protein [Ignavibacteria bacterium]
MESLTSILVLVGIAGISVLLIIFITKNLSTVAVPQTSSISLDEIEGINEIGLERNEAGFKGVYRDYVVSVSNTIGDGTLNDRYQVVAVIAPEKDDAEKIEKYSSSYFVTNQHEGFAHAGFMLNPHIFNEADGNLKKRLDSFIDVLTQEKVKPYKA